MAHADWLTRRRAQSPFSAQTLPAICSSPPAAHNAQARLRFFKLLKVMRVLVGTISLLRLTSFLHLPGGGGLPHKSRDRLNRRSLRQAPCPGPCWARQRATGSPPPQYIGKSCFTVFRPLVLPELTLQSFGHLMQKTDSSEKTLMLGKIEGRRRRGQQRMRWLDGITNSMDVSEQAPGDGRSSSPWGHKQLDMTE